MTIKTTLSALAIVAAMSGSAFAQTMLAGNEVSESDLPFVKAYCSDLQLQDATSTPAGVKPNDPAADTVDTTDSPDGADADLDASNATVSIDLSSITLDDCREAGLLATQQ